MKRKLTMLLTLHLLAIGFLIAQTQVRGFVVDEAGDPVIGATIQIKGTSQGTVTDIDGRFALQAAPTAKLVISYVGYKTQELPVSANMNVVLVSDSELLQEVVIVGAMGVTRPPRSAGYGQSVVDPAEAIQKAEPDLFRSLDGKIPGVHVSASSATPGSATKVLIRGNTSFLGNNDPLYVVDGVPYNNPEVTTGDIQARLTNSGAYGTGISTLDPNDIESMTVLKGAAAAALYGSRAANGVVMITTKAGSKRIRPSQKGFEVTINSSYTTETIASLPEYQNKYGQGSDFQYSNANGSWGPAFGSPGNETIPLYPSVNEAFPELGPRIPYQAYPNNVKDLFRTGGILDNSINIMSYNDRGSYSLTVSNLNQDGYIPYSDFDRTSFSIGGNQKLENGLTIGGTLSYTRTDQNGPFFGAGNYSGSVSSFARAMLLPRNVDIPGLPYETLDGRNLMPFSSSTVDNPLWSWKYNTVNSVQDRTVSTVNANYDITDWLTAGYQFGWNQYVMERKEVINIGSVGPEDLEGLGQITNFKYASQELESNFNVTMKHEFDDNLDLRVTLGHNVNQRSILEDKQVGKKMIAKGIYNVDNTLEQTAEEEISKRRLWALYVDAMLSYKNYAFLNLTVRNDHSSTLPVKHNSYYYPAIAGSFVFSDAFEIDPDILSFGKVRLAWGRVGNDAGPYYNDGSFLQDPPFGGNPIMLLPTVYFDPELKPEFTSEFEAGTELQFFNGRAGLDFTWYSRSTTNQIAPLSVASSAGLRQYYTNFGELSNKGVEIGFNLVPVQLGNSIKWDISGTFTKNISEVVSTMDDGTPITLSTGSTSEPQPTLMKGYPYGFLRGTVIARDDEGNMLVHPSTGAYIADVNLGDLGNPYPDFRASLNNTLTYKGFSLGVVFDARVGGILISGPASDLMGRGLTLDTEDRLGTRILPGVLGDPDTGEPLLDANGNKIPNTVQLSENDLWFSPDVGNTFSINGVDEFQAFDATVYRLSEISLGFDLPKKWLRDTFLGSVNLSVIARNLWYYAPGFPKYTNYDPGANAFGSGNVQGIDRESAPSTRRIGFNAKITF